MREKWAKRIVLLTALIVLLLASLFASIQNPKQSADNNKNSEQQAFAFDSKRVEAGRRIYQQQNCSLCHSINGQGNPRSSLDGVGEKRNASELHLFITGADSLQDLLPEGIRKMKKRYSKLPEDNLDDLVIYMQSLR